MHTQQRRRYSRFHRRPQRPRLVRTHPLSLGGKARGSETHRPSSCRTHVQRTFLRCQSSRPAFAPTNPSLNMSSLVTGLITADLTDLIRIGLVTLSNKLSPPMTSTTRPISDDKLLARLNEIWLFFFTGVLPHLEGVFWVLRSDDRLRAAVGESEAGRTTGSDGSGTPYGAQGFADTRIDVRRIALIEFRDCIVHPEMDRLVQIFASFYPPPNTATTSNGQYGRPMEGFESRTSTRPPSVSQNYSDMNDSPHPSLAKNPYRRSRSPPPHSAAFPPPDRPGPSQRHQSSPARLSPNPEYIPSFEPRSPGMRSASGGSQFRLPRRTASHSSTSGFPRPFENPTTGGSDGSAAGGIGREDGMLAQTPAEAQALARRRQMTAILASLLTADDRQAEMDELVRLLRPVYNARYRRAPLNEDEEDQSQNHNGGGGHVDYEEEDSGARTVGERDLRRRSGTGTPPPVAAGADSSGARTSLTASPVMLSQELHDPVPDFNSHLSPFPVQPHQSGRTGVATFVDGTSSQISARQRSRTMNSLDEEQSDGHHYKVASRSPRLSDVQAHDAQDSRPQRHSIDVPASAAAAAAAGGPARIPSSTSLRSGKKTRRLSFRPWLGRSNSAASSSVTSIDGGGASSLAAATEDGTGTSGAASLTPGTVEGDRLRRGLLRRNSSRRTSDLSSIVPQLGVGYGQLAEDPAADEETDWRERQS